MKNWSAHFIVDQSFSWKSLEKVFPEIFGIIKGKKELSQEEEQHYTVKLELNMREISNDKKPLGFHSEENGLTLIFPLDSHEMTIANNSSSEKVYDAAEEVSKLLKTKKIKFKLEYDKMKLIEIMKTRK